MISRNYVVVWTTQVDREELLPIKRLGACDFLLLFTWAPPSYRGA
jgi:hypothetical protein